ncbi:MAG: HAMP domain-containing histidine kinase [Oscillospiraceae bacterium]|nr:HAMP domain-containing histidine kinase [Oscillospiraceae bacterium]MCL2278043.1 HAMP domain-containing histidine kinase [Oscillospiraceae bacterium]
METVKKRWTALRVVKIISFVAIILTCISFLSRGLMFTLDAEDAGVSTDIIFANLDSPQYFHNNNMWRAQNDAWFILQFGSEDSIRAGQHLRWEQQIMRGWSHILDMERTWVEHTLIDTVQNWNIVSVIAKDTAIIAEGVPEIEFAPPRLAADIFQRIHGDSDIEVDSDDYIYFRHIESQDTEILETRSVIEHPIFDMEFGLRIDSPEARRELEDMAIERQLAVFEDSLERLNDTEGLLFLITPTTPEHSDFINLPLSNVSLGRQTEEYFSAHSVSHLENNLFLAFDDSFVRYIMDIYIQLQQSLTLAIINMAGQIALALFLLVVLLCGAGRKYRMEGVYFSPVDRPYLDISLLAVFAIVAFAVFLFAETLGYIWDLGQDNMVAIHLVFALASIVLVTPILLWLMSFAKRIKAGKFWKHTLIYAVLVKVLFGGLLLCIKKSRNLWAGAKLTGKVALISGCAFTALLIIGVLALAMDFSGIIALFPMILIVTAGIAILLLRFAKRIHALEIGALRVNEGNYETPIEVGGGELGSIAASINNITEGIHTAVDQRMKSERLKTELITNVSHDIRTPLTSIITYTDLLKHEGLNSEKAPEYLDILAQKSQRLKTLTDELFEAAKAVSGNIDVNLTDLDISSLLRQVLGENDSAINDSGLDVRSNFPDKLIVRADGRLMQRALENLLSNALKYSLPASRIYIDVTETKDKRMKLDIKNISATELNFDPSELVERFKRGDDSRSDGGNGLGLSIVQSFVNAQGGQFEIAIDGDLFKAIVTLPSS